jgi:hypothetical protein
MTRNVTVGYDKIRGRIKTSGVAVGVPKPEELRQRHTYYREGFVPRRGTAR